MAQRTYNTSPAEEAVIAAEIAKTAGTTADQWVAIQLGALIEQHRHQQTVNAARDAMDKLTKLPEATRDTIIETIDTEAAKLPPEPEPGTER